MPKEELKELLEELTLKYNTPEFIECDPISIPHQFERKEDREISGLLVSLIAWGNRTMILRNGNSMVERMDFSPMEFLHSATLGEIKRASRGFVHRTFNEDDLYETLRLLQIFMQRHRSLGDFFEKEYKESQDIRVVLSKFRSELFSSLELERTTRHISSIDKGSACKRLCMYLRWMVRQDGRGVDFGLWSSIPPSALYIPLDVHSARQGRALGLLERKANDWRAVEELTTSLRALDPLDPVKYDFALFGVGVNG